MWAADWLPLHWASLWEAALLFRDRQYSLLLRLPRLFTTSSTDRMNTPLSSVDLLLLLLLILEPRASSVNQALPGTPAARKRRRAGPKQKRIYQHAFAYIPILLLLPRRAYDSASHPSPTTRERRERQTEKVTLKEKRGKSHIIPKSLLPGPSTRLTTVNAQNIKMKASRLNNTSRSTAPSLALVQISLHPRLPSPLSLLLIDK